MRLLILLAVVIAPIEAQRPAFSGEVEVRQALERLNTLGSVMMIGAHPDDERETVLAYLALGRHVRTAYLSLTRGEGGQNLIGPEQGDALGMIRTQELLASRRIDGAEQYFTRAIDFGFSKTAEETLKKWDRQKVLADVVWNIRRFRPDVVVLVFSGTPRDGHGHHQTSAILGKEAFTAAADPTRFPEQLAYVQTWQARRLMMNAPGQGPGGPNAQGNPNPGGRGRGQVPQNPPTPTTPPQDLLDLDVGVYSPELGYSFGQIGGWSRSANRSQGTGAAERPGSQKNSLETVIGDKATKDIFENIDITWNRIPGGQAVGTALKETLDAFVPSRPQALLDSLAKARPMLASLAASSKDPLVERKLKELDETMVLCAGLWLDATADKAALSPGATSKINVVAVARMPVQAALTGVRLTGMEGAPALDLAPAVLVSNQPRQYSLNLKVPENQPYSQPYWLEQPKDGSLYTVRDPRQIGNPENAPLLEAHFSVRIAGTNLEITRPVQHRFVDRVLGESVSPLPVTPPVAVELEEQAMLFPSTAPRKLEVLVRSIGGEVPPRAVKVSADVRLELSPGWKAEPAVRHFDFASSEEQTTVSFEITPPQADTRGRVRAVAQVGQYAVSSGVEVLRYPHIMTETLFPTAEAALVRAEIKNVAKRIGYVMGPGDEVGHSLEQIGCEITMLSANDLARGDLSRYDAIVTGPRAFEARQTLTSALPRLMEYASNGGTLIVQYPTQVGGNGMEVANLGPYPLRLSRERVTVEDAPITFPNPQLAMLHTPNEITPADFEGWVQERGLYFADQWDPKYLSVLESHDPGEQPLLGGMLYARVGKGAFIYTAYAWFRQLPAGVPGAYRMFANMLNAAKVQP